jgi:hypothetical protein
MATDGAQAARIESFFRDVNDRIAEAAEEDELGDSQFICECPDPECTERLHVPLDEYEDVRGEPTRFIVKPGHVAPEVERIVEVADDYDVVEKDVPDAAAVAEELDPRS